MFARKIFALVAVARTGLSVRVETDLSLMLDESQLDGFDEMRSFDKRAIVDKPADICGSSKIWEVITYADQDEGTMDSWRKMVTLQASWPTIEGFKTEFMDMQGKEKKRLEGEIAGLQQRLSEEESKEKIGKTTNKDHQELLEKSFGSEGSYGSTDNAFKWNCGGDYPEDADESEEPGEDADLNAVEKFSEIIEGYLKDKGVLLDLVAFKASCYDAVVRDRDEKVNFCGEICLDMESKGKKASNKIQFTNSGNSLDVKKRIEDNKQELSKVENSMESCTVDFKVLTGFKEQAEGLRGTYQVCGKELREARRAIGSLAKEGKAVDDHLLEEDAKLQEIADMLNKNVGATKDAITALEAAKAKDKKLKIEVKGLTTVLETMGEDLKAAENANSLVAELKAAVVDTMLKMETYGNWGVREPIKNLGFSEDPSDLEFVEPKDTDAAGKMYEALDAMSKHCQEQALPVFKKIKDQVDLTGLCKFDTTENMYQDLTESVTHRYTAIKKDMLMVIDWLNPWKMTHATIAEGEKKEEELVKAGQLNGLELVKALYLSPTSHFVTPYLIGWRKGGPHHAKVKALAEHVGKLTARHDEGQKKLELSMAASDDSSKAKETAVQKLKEAQAKEKDAAGLKADIEKALALLQEQQKKMDDQMAALKDRYKKAMEAYKEAQKALGDAYEKATA